MSDNKKYAVMLFDTEINLGVSSTPNKWVNTKNVYFDNGVDALKYYVETYTPAIEIIEAKDDYELQCKMGEMMINYTNDNWLNENLYPYL